MMLLVCSLVSLVIGWCLGWLLAVNYRMPFLEHQEDRLEELDKEIQAMGHYLRCLKEKIDGKKGS